MAVTNLPVTDYKLMVLNAFDPSQKCALCAIEGLHDSLFAFI